MNKLLGLTLLTCTLMSSPSFGGEIAVLNAVIKDKAIEGAQVTWQRNGESSQLDTTSSEGKAAIPSSLVDDSDTTMLISKPGYSTLVVKCPCDNFTYALSPVMQNLNGLRVVLTWGKNPLDLDSHLIYPSDHVYYADKIGSDTNLDVDDTNSYGPETITIDRKHDGERYIYAVHDFTNGSGDFKSSSELSFSHARVEVYIGKTLVRTYRVKPGTTANSWIVFGIDDNGAFHDINQYLSLSRSDLASHMNSLIKANSFENHSLIASSIKKQAKHINTYGESLYHEKRLEDAMYEFQSAIDLYPSYGQAYSNLGLTYQKLNRTAEALWANRKAIDLASGKNKNRVQASSYYNIARIYEATERWQDALDSFKRAKTLRQHDAYDKGIARMQEKLK